MGFPGVRSPPGTPREQPLPYGAYNRTLTALYSAITAIFGLISDCARDFVSVLYNDGKWYRCQIAGINKGSGTMAVKLGTGKRASLKKNCAHVMFPGGDPDDVVHFDVAKYGKPRVYTNSNSSYAWVFRTSEIPGAAAE